MNINPEKAPESLPQSIITQIVRSLTDLAETTLWGKSNKQQVLTLSDIKNWFNELPPHYKKKIALAAVLRMDATSGSLRIYQGIFDKGLNCFLARQLLVEQMSSDLIDLFGHEKVIIFLEDPKSLSKTTHLGD